MEAGSVWQKIKKIRWKRFLPLVLAILCLAAGVREFASMPRENALPVFLEGTYPDQNRAEEILNKKTEQADSIRVKFIWLAFWEMQGFTTGAWEVWQRRIMKAA